MPAYAPGTTLHIYGAAGQGRSLEAVLRGQMQADYFPVALGDLPSAVQVHEYHGETLQIGEANVSATYLNHPGMTLGYRVERAGRMFVYATDHEPYRSTLETGSRRAEAGKQFGRVLDAAVVAFVKGADLYIGEAQYTDEEYPAKVGWGHSSLSATVEVALQGEREGARPLSPRSDALGRAGDRDGAPSPGSSSPRGGRRSAASRPGRVRWWRSEWRRPSERRDQVDRRVARVIAASDSDDNSRFD